MTKAAKVLLTAQAGLLAAAANPSVASAISGFAAHHPWLATLGLVLSSIGHLLVKPTNQGSNGK